MGIDKKIKNGSAELVDKWKGKADSLVDELEKKVPEKLELLGELVDNVDKFWIEFEAKREIFEKAGFFADNANVNFTIPPAISLTFRIEETLKDTENTDLLKSMSESDSPILKKLLESLILITRNKAGKYLPKEISIQLGLPPKIQLFYSLNKK